MLWLEPDLIKVLKKVTEGWLKNLTTDRAVRSPYKNPHFLVTSSNKNIFRGTGPMWGESSGHRWIPPTKASGAELLMFSLIGARTNGWAHNRDADDFGHHRAHHDVPVTTFTTAHQQPDIYGTLAPYPILRNWHDIVIWNCCTSVYYFGRFFVSVQNI